LGGGGWNEQLTNKIETMSEPITIYQSFSPFAEEPGET
jgi:hypothetical protein